MYIIPSDLVRKFHGVSSNNYSQNGKHIETLGFLLGYKSNDNYVATDLIFPEQQATCSRVDDKGIGGEDTLVWAFQTYMLEKKKKPIVIAWIHSHVGSVKCNFSSVDLHTQHTYSKLHNGILGMVVEIHEDGSLGEHDFYEMSRQGKRFVENCSQCRFVLIAH